MQLRTSQPAVSALALPLWALLTVACTTAVLAQEPRPASDAVSGGFKIAVDGPGVYRIGYEDLAAAGLDAAFLRSRALSLTRGGRPVPIWIEDGGDGRLGRGDWIELVVTEPAADAGPPEPPDTIFLLQLRPGPALRMRPESLVQRRSTAGEVDPAAGPGAPDPLRPGRPPRALVSRFHLEEDRLFLRFPGESPETSEVWYWARLTPHDESPVVLPLELAGLDLESDLPIRLRLRLRGWSHLLRQGPNALPIPEGFPDHRLEVRLAGRALGVAEWSNRKQGYLWESPPLPARELIGRDGSGQPELALAIVPRTLGDDPVVDVAMLDWVEVLYPRRDEIEAGQARLLPLTTPEPGAGDAGPDSVDLDVTGPARGLALYTADGRRLAGSHQASHGGGETFAGYRPAGYTASGLAASSSPWIDPGTWAVAAGGLHRPKWIRRLRTDGLRDPERRADYVMIVHPSLAGAVAPLASAHRRRGLAVEVVDVRAVYDEFGHGVPGPHPIRDFLRWARAHWRPPALRQVLLVGDASWDTRSRRARPFAYADRPYLPGRGATLGSRRAPRYEHGSGRNDRDLVPTGSTATFEGHAASDAWLVQLDGDELPDLSIGRLPAADRREAKAMVAKTLRYLERPRVGPWRRQALFVSDGSPYIDTTSARVSLALADDGFAALRVRPEEDDASPEVRRERLLAALDRGPLLVHFFGHGGRNIWRTGGSGGEADRDLFTLEDLDRLAPRDRLPIVLSMTCYSAPFDHPSADSIGEKFLRLPGRGAVAVVAASWRNTPTERMSRVLTDELIAGGTVGEALLRAKRRSRSAEFIGQYNLLGDPALPLQLPGRLTVRQALTRREQLPMVVAEIPGAPGRRFSGRAIVDWLDRSGEVMQRQEIEVDRPGLSAVFAGTPGQLRRLAMAQVYLWDEASERDALGGTPIRLSARGAGPQAPPRPDAVRVAKRPDGSSSEVRR